MNETKLRTACDAEPGPCAVKYLKDNWPIRVQPEACAVAGHPCQFFNRDGHVVIMKEKLSFLGIIH